MDEPDEVAEPPASGGAERRVTDAFQTTRWSVVLKAGGEVDGDRGAALATLCHDYWYPIYAFVRRRGSDHHDAEDLTQGFFAMVLERQDIGTADPQKGRFRSYLLTAMKNFLAKEHRHNSAQKRGGGRPTISIDSDQFDRRFQTEAAHDLTPEVLFHRSWATTLLGKVMAQLGLEYEESGKSALFEELGERLAEPKGRYSNDEAAANLGMSSGAVAVALHRMRGRYRELLRRGVRDTLSGGETELDVDAEIQQLLSVLG